MFQIKFETTILHILYKLKFFLLNICFIKVCIYIFNYFVDKYKIAKYESIT